MWLTIRRLKKPAKPLCGKTTLTMHDSLDATVAIAAVAVLAA